MDNTTMCGVWCNLRRSHLRPLLNPSPALAGRRCPRAITRSSDVFSRLMQDCQSIRDTAVL